MNETLSSIEVGRFALRLDIMRAAGVPAGRSDSLRWPAVIPCE
jgi:hypothetical protein